MLTADDLARYRADGYLVCPGLLARESCDALTGHLSACIARAASEYVAGAREELGFWDLMRRSRAGLEVFWDPSRGSPRGGLEGATMRVGHALHAVDPVFERFCAEPALRGGLRQIVDGPGVLLQSAIVYKQPRSEAVQFGMHQDAWYLTTEPESLALAFVALDDMDRENGCLEVLPGSHRGPVDVALRMGPTGFVPASGPRQGTPSRRRSQPREPSRDRAVALEVAKGSVVFVHGRMYHASGPNRADRPRRALIVHAMSDASRIAPTAWILECGLPPPLVRL